MVGDLREECDEERSKGTALNCEWIWPPPDGEWTDCVCRGRRGEGMSIDNKLIESVSEVPRDTGRCVVRELSVCLRLVCPSRKIRR